MNATARHLLKAFGKGCIIGAIAGPAIAIPLASYGWRTVQRGRKPFWLANNNPYAYRQTTYTGRQLRHQRPATTGTQWTSPPPSANEAAPSRPRPTTKATV